MVRIDDLEGRPFTTRQQQLIFAMLQWSEYAACTGSDLPFTADRVRSQRINKANDNKAKEVCQHCPVRLNCLTHALNFPETQGVWGGLSAEERSRYRK